VVPTLGRSDLLKLALHGALGQQEVDLEVVVVDDDGRDDIAGLVDRLGDPRLRLLRHDRRRGVSTARNTGVESSRGDWIAFLDDDDLWAATKLRAQLDAARRTGRTWAYCGAVAIDPSNRVLHVELVPPPDDLSRQLARRNVVPAGASNVLVHRLTLTAAGGFEPGLRLTEDWDLFIRLSRLQAAALVAEPLVAFRVHPLQSSLDASRLLAELKSFERRHGVRTDRVAVLRGAAWACLQAGRRRDALRLYLQSVQAGDLSSLGRVVAPLLPRRAIARLVKKGTASIRNSDPQVLEAQRWVNQVVLASARNHGGAAR
jgi:glycosyltransferase involved in cell wall biosynthesis